MAKIVPAYLSLLPQKAPKIIRPRLQDKEAFATALKHQLVGKKYDYQRILHLMLYLNLQWIAPSIARRLPRQTDTLKPVSANGRVVCSHAIL